ncbi:MAG: hypothetical protein KatS3mg089_0915 [Patescibacteria group bacterium]|nr:MAG: hypothetical protein KatS3mg089_0915 [Patescibacteria group bacterium]
MRKYSFILTYCLVALVVTVFFAAQAHAATLTGAKDTITTSRPSPSTPLSANAASGAYQVSVYNNGSRFLASDSAKLIRGTTLIDPVITIASQSAGLTSVYFSDALGAAGQNGTDVLFFPVTAMHTIQFTVQNTIPTNGDIVITFPTLSATDADNDASPSATTFQFNNLVSGTGGRDNIDVYDDSTDISANVTITETEPSPGNPGIISINLDSGTIAAGSVVKIYLGCTASTSASCTTQAPRIINPTKSATAGTADIWKINISTKDSSGILLDEATVAIGTIETVEVRATVDATLTFSIGGIANGSAVNTGNTTGCAATETTSAGNPSTATLVDLGVLANTPTTTGTPISNIAAQLITITTNAANGYTLTATSSGQLRNFQSGFAIASSTTPQAFPNGTHFFGINACGLDVNTSTWGNNNCNTYITGSSNACKYGWPTPTTAITLASDSTGPVGNTITAGNGLVTVRYAASIDASVPSGEYQTAITYVATPTF